MITRHAWQLRCHAFLYLKKKKSRAHAAFEYQFKNLFFVDDSTVVTTDAGSPPFGEQRVGGGVKNMAILLCGRRPHASNLVICPILLIVNIGL